MFNRGGDLKFIIMTLGLSLLCVTQASAQYSGQLSTASTTAEGLSKVGAYAGIYDGAIGILGQYRYGVGAYTDIGFKLGILDLDRGVVHDAGADFAFDFKYRVMEKRLRDPFDLSLGGAAEFLTVNNLNIFSIGLNAIGSYPILLSNGHTLEPYGRLNLRAQHDNPSYGSSNTDFEIGLNMGTAFELSRSTRAFAEFQFDDPFAFFLGVDFDL
jgi:hypothetical protein